MNNPINQFRPQPFCYSQTIPYDLSKHLFELCKINNSNPSYDYEATQKRLDEIELFDFQKKVLEELKEITKSNRETD